MAQSKQKPFSESRRGFTLVEMAITAVLIGIIAVGILPLFTRAISNNIYGADASQLAAFLRSGNERVQQVAISDTALGLDSNVGTNPSSGVDPDDFIFTDDYAIRSVPLYYDSGVRDSLTRADRTIGDETWKLGTDTPSGLFLWRQRREIREYSVADIFRGNISVNTSSGSATLSPLGNPKLFDTPQVRTGLADIREIRMIVESTKGGIDSGALATASGIKQKAIVKAYRAF